MTYAELKELKQTARILLERNVQLSFDPEGSDGAYLVLGDPTSPDSQCIGEIRDIDVVQFINACSPERIKALVDEAQMMKEGLEAVARQYGIVSQGLIHTGGMSVLEEVFDLLGWDDPCPAPKDRVCDVDGCGNAVSCGWSSDEGYRLTCGDHYRNA